MEKEMEERILNFSINFLLRYFQYYLFFFSIKNTRQYYNELYKSDRKWKRCKDQIGMARDSHYR